MLVVEEGGATKGRSEDNGATKGSSSTAAAAAAATCAEAATAAAQVFTVVYEDGDEEEMDGSDVRHVSVLPSQQWYAALVRPGLCTCTAILTVTAISNVPMGTCFRSVCDVIVVFVLLF
jgi:hypothetical protein